MEREVQTGCPKGAGTVEPDHGGKIGNPAHEWSQEIADKVELLAQVCNQETTAQLAGISYSTLHRHYHEAWERGRSQAILEVKQQVLKQAREGSVNAAKVFLAMSGELKRQVEHSAPGGGPIRTLDVGIMARLVEGKDEEELKAFEQALTLILAATGTDGGPGDGPADAELRPDGEAEA